MFGYVRPYVPEMKVRELERFRACYCGLCHELGREYGLAGRSILNYDFVFLAMLLWGDRPDCGYEYRRCLPGLCRKRCVCQTSPSLTVAAGYSVILAYWKARDGRADGRGAKKLGAAAVCAFLHRAYTDAAGRYPEFDAQVRQRLDALAALERAGEPSLDKPAHEFASLLSFAANAAGEEEKRPLEQLLYHVGRIIYLADGYFDLEDDLKTGNYNPVAARYALREPHVPEDVREEILGTLMSSARMSYAAFQLMPVSYWTSVTENIIGLGIPDMIRAVIDGTYKTVRRGLPKSPLYAGGGEMEQ